MMAVHRCNTLIITRLVLIVGLLVLETLLRCLLLKCWQVVVCVVFFLFFFRFSAASEANRDLSESQNKLSGLTNAHAGVNT